MSNNTQPEIRFPGFTEDWEERKLNELAEFNPKSDLPERFEYVDLESVVGTELVGHRTENRYSAPSRAQRLAKKNDVFYQTVRPYQKNNYLFDLPYDNYVFSTGYAQMRPIGNGYFLLTLIQEEKFVNRVLERSTGTSYPAINSNDLAKLPVKVPADIQEQQKVGTFFKQIDNIITLHQRKLDLLKETKKGFLQKMFPKNGAKVPEIRFPGFTEDWEQRKLASMTNYKNGKGHEDKQSTIGKLELINLNSISISGGLKHSGKFIDEADDTLQKDDLVMILSDVGHGDLLGRVALIPEDDRFVLNQRVALLRPNATADPQFLFSYINAHQYYFKAQGAGMSQLNISKGSVENFISFVPIIEEQKKIGTFFKQLDDTIALHQRKLDLLKETKKGFLQKMFV
ncbi:restriction endonuclease subunit S [Enterococcus faecalis]|uniref:restriction endonuclease subunit S n=1 Tax=Enterococcus faecalis TaxID=1351 RepID=UPI001D4DF738|nr:restriction endonuclease subunit S [Enterococcus faecalis]EHB6441913.1 restriction endonuclease subunit S [Enterococcus faecalis]HEQ3563189.1 restriction endonuclease subunit S [Enterococcus faecalis]